MLVVPLHDWLLMCLLQVGELSNAAAEPRSKAPSRRRIVAIIRRFARKDKGCPRLATVTNGLRKRLEGAECRQEIHLKSGARSAVLTLYKGRDQYHRPTRCKAATERELTDDDAVDRQQIPAARSRSQAEEAVAKLQLVVILSAQSKSAAEAVRSIGVGEVSCVMS